MIDEAYTWDAVVMRALESILRAAGAEPRLARRAFELKFTDLLDRLLFLRDGINRFNKQNIAGAIDTVLECWPHFTETLFAVASAYGHAELLHREQVRRKVVRNLRGGDTVPIPQCHEFDRVVALLCPKASGWVRSSPVV
jgi:hypothetical protein